MKVADIEKKIKLSAHRSLKILIMRQDDIGYKGNVTRNWKHSGNCDNVNHR